MSDEHVPARGRKKVSARSAAEPRGGTAVKEDRPKLTGLRRGWGGADAVAEENSPFATAFRLTDESQIIVFLEDEPYVSYPRHWVGGGGNRNNRPYTCLTAVGQDCPLCDVLGDRPSATTAFNIAHLTEDGHALHRTWDTGVRIARILRDNASDNNSPSLSETYAWSVKSLGQGTYAIIPIDSEDALEKRYAMTITPEMDDEIKSIKPYTPDIVSVPSKEDLEKVVLAATASQVDPDGA